MRLGMTYSTVCIILPLTVFKLLTRSSLPVGVSYITPEEAAKLPMPTLPIPGTDKYLVELEVFHVLHCLNDIRKVFYPEVYGEAILNLTQADGTLDRENNFFRHFGELPLP